MALATKLCLATWISGQNIAYNKFRIATKLIKKHEVINKFLDKIQLSLSKCSYSTQYAISISKLQNSSFPISILNAQGTPGISNFYSKCTKSAKMTNIQGLR